MRLIVNPKEQHDNRKPSMHYNAAALFAEEYNKHVPEGVKAKIVIPYSLLLSKADFLFPESKELPPQEGRTESDLAMLFREKSELFEVVFTKADERLYNELHEAALGVLARAKADKARGTPVVKLHEEHYEEALPENVVNDIRREAIAFNKHLQIAGQNIDSWFSDNKIGIGKRFPGLLVNSRSGEIVSGPGLYLTLLQRADVRDYLTLPKHLPDFAESKPLYASWFQQLANLVQKLNDDIRHREEQASEEAQEFTQELVRIKKADRKEGIAFAQSELNEVIAKGEGSDSLKHIDLNMLLPERELNGRAFELIYGESKKKLEGAALFHAIVTQPKFKKKYSGAIVTAANEAVEELVADSHEPTLAIVDASNIRNGHVPIAVPSSEANNAVENFADDHEGVAEIMNSRGAVVIQESAKGDTGFVKHVDPKHIYQALRERLTTFRRNDHSASDASIDKALQGIHEALNPKVLRNVLESSRLPRRQILDNGQQEENHQNGFVRTNGATTPDVAALQKSLEGLDGLLNDEDMHFPKIIRDGLQSLRKQLAGRIPGLELSGVKRAVGE